MIQFLSDNIDQLDLALDQIAIKDRNFDRFALMLIDNVVELTLHRYIQDKAGENEMWGRLGSPKHDPKVIEKGLGQNFDSKVKAGAKLGLINDELCESILNLHTFRNTAYHKGMRHEKILHSLVVFYFRSACILLKAYEPGWWSWTSSDRISHRAMKYIGKEMPRKHEEVFLSAYARLDEVAATMDENLIGDLSSDMAETIDSMDDAISFLANEGPEKKSRDEVIIDSQAWPFAFTDEAKEYARQHGCQESYVGPYIDWLSKHYDWPVNKDPISSWRTRLGALAKETDYHKALKKYCDFMRQTESIRSHIYELANQLDAHIQQQIDSLRD